MATILTDVGRTKLLAATPMTPVTLSHIAFGDGSGSIPSVIATRTALVNEVIRVDCTSPVRDTTDMTVIKVQGSIPRTFGGVTLREVGLFDSVGDLIAYGSVNNEALPVPTDEFGFTYLGVMRVKLDNTTMVTVINSDAPAFDHRGLTFRDEPDAHPASSITMSQSGRTVQSMFNLMKVLNSSGQLLVGEDNIITSNTTQTLPSTSGLSSGSKVYVSKLPTVVAVVQCNNIATEQIKVGTTTTDSADYDSVVYDIHHQLVFTWNGTYWGVNI